MLLAIDPGTDTGWAVFSGKVLADCGLGTPPAEYARPDRVLIEVPKFRPSDPNPQSLIVLAVKAGEHGGRYAKPEYLIPNDWKGSTPKPISHARIWGVLDPAEQGIVDRKLRGVAAGKRHNVLDAIGIGLHGVGRNANGR